MMESNWKDFFIFSKKELKGIIVLGIILTGSVSLRLFFPSKETQPGQMGDETKLPNAHLSFFDPNTIDSLQAIQLGIPEKQVKNLLNYRSKGGYFKTAESFSKLYGLTPATYNRLQPYIKIEKIKKETYSYETKRGTAFYGYGAKKRNSLFDKEEIWRIDINTENEQEWNTKTNIPNYLLQRIMAYKHYRGAFSKPSDLSKVYGMPDSIYQKLRPHLWVNPNKANLLNAEAMGFKDWKDLGMFTDQQVWTILRLKRSLGGHLYWKQLVEALDLNQKEGTLLQTRVRFNAE